MWPYFEIKLNLGVLGAIALCFLIIKRYRENPLIRRSWTIWLLDTSKQVAGMVFVHFINVIWEGGHINYSWRLLSLKLRFVQTQSISFLKFLSDPPLSDIDFKN